MLLPDGSMFARARLLRLWQGPRSLSLTLLFLLSPGVRLAFMFLRHPDALRVLSGWPGLNRLPLRPGFLGTLPFLLTPRGSRFPAFGPSGLRWLPFRAGFLGALPLLRIWSGPRFPPFRSGFLFLSGPLPFLIALIVLTVERSHGFQQQRQNPNVDKPKRFHGVNLPLGEWPVFRVWRIGCGGWFDSPYPVDEVWIPWPLCCGQTFAPSAP
jgi:hypothetical protein